MTIWETEDEIEEREEGVLEKETLKALAARGERYKSLFGELPPDSMTPAEIQDKIVEEMTRQGLRPYKL